MMLISPAAPMPCRTRAAVSWDRVWDRAQASEAARACLRNALSTAWCAWHGSPPPAELLQQRTLLAWSAAHGYAALAIDHPAQSVPLFPPELIFAPLMPALLAP